jgi:hypothetical protein
MNKAAKAALARLDAFIGEWVVEASFPGSNPGHASFEWALDGQYVIERTEAPDPAPDSIAIISVDPKTGKYTQHYFDTRGVVRVYAMRFKAGAWELSRKLPDFSPLHFSQRFKGRFSRDRNVIKGTWETSTDGRRWKRDFDLTYRKVKHSR